MSSASQEVVRQQQSRPATRIGILLVGLQQANIAALRFLVLQMNRVQVTFEYEFLPVPDDDFIRHLKRGDVLDRDEIKARIPAFTDRYRSVLAKQNIAYGLQEEPAEHFVVVSLARFADQFYSTRRQAFSVLALGNWERFMAPPSILEFILTLIVREAVAAISPSLRGSVHLGTKGCLFDFTPSLDEVRFKVLGAFVCGHCSSALQTDGYPQVAAEIRSVLGKGWLGRVDDPGSPAAMVAKLGYNLFTTKGLKATPWEKILGTLQEEGVKLVLAVIGSVVGALVLVWLGLKVS